MKLIKILLLISLVTVSAGWASICNDTYYANWAILTTLRGNSLQTLTQTSRDSIIFNYNDIAKLPGLDYTILNQLTSTCTVFGTQVLTHLMRANNENSFVKTEEQYLTIFQDQATVGTQSYNYVLVTKKDNKAQEVIQFDLTSGIGQMLYVGTLLTDTVTSITGNVIGISSLPKPWTMVIDYDGHINEFQAQINGYPELRSGSQDTTHKHTFVQQQLRVFYKNVPVDSASVAVSQGPDFGLQQALNSQDNVFGITSIYTLEGTLIKQFVPSSGGLHWDGLDISGNKMSPGVYLITHKNFRKKYILTR